MLVYLFAALQALAYLVAVPVCAAFWLSAEDGLRFGVGLSAFERRFALRRARRNGLRRRPALKARRGGNMQRAWSVLRRLRGASVRLEGRLGLGDAAATALACGALRVAGTTLAGRENRVRIDVAPAFCDGGVCVELRGMLRVRTGQIILAAARSGIENANRRIVQWINTRSKAS